MNWAGRLACAFMAICAAQIVLAVSVAIVLFAHVDLRAFFYFGEALIGTVCFVIALRGFYWAQADAK